MYAIQVLFIIIGNNNVRQFNLSIVFRDLVINRLLNIVMMNVTGRDKTLFTF